MKSFNLTRYSVTHPIGIFMIVLFFVVLGLYSYWRIGGAVSEYQCALCHRVGAL